MTVEPRPKPRKRPSQARSKFTVLAIYEAFVRIWRLRGWSRLSTRAVALETGISVGTLYDYFPNKDALLSGYVRHCIEWMLAAIEQEAVAAAPLGLRARVERLVRISCGALDAAAPYYDEEMLLLENRIAERKHHRRVFDELCEAWQRAIDRWPEAPINLDAAAVRSLVLLVMGARRYSLLIHASGETPWMTELIEMCQARLEAAARPSHPGGLA